MIAAFLTTVCLLCAPVRASVPVLTQNDPTTQLIGTELFVPAGLDRQSSSQNGLAALVAECIVQTPVALSSGQRIALRSMIAGEGGAISYAVGGHEVRFYLEGLSETYSALLLPAFRRALSGPDFSVPALQSARAALRERIAQSAADPLDVGMEMLGRTFYTNSNAGLPRYGTLAMQMQFNSDDARAFYAAHYRRDGAVVSAIGNLPALRPSDLRSLANALSPGPSLAARVRTATLSGASRQLVAHRDLTVTWLVAQYRAPAITSRDFGAMLVLSAFFSRTLSEVAQIPSVSTADLTRRSAGVIYNFGTRPASVVFFVGGGLGDPARTFAAALAVARVFKSARLHGNIDDLKAGALGYFDGSANSLEERARLAGTFTLLGASPDYWGRASEAVSATTATDIQRVAKRYLVSPTVALILPRAAPAPQ
ncbi:MAG: hypothetical protein M3M96_08725 [Candidatus Eremiobacteraeota bacterium]|nr:hypothetical protein [Candidatus Eremiobacteraeota bacterium]